VGDRVGERPGDDRGHGRTAGAADPSDDRGDGLDVQAGQPAEDGSVPLAEVDPGGAQRVPQQVGPGLRADDRPVVWPQRQERLA
jgi:hypothetical protein